MARLNIVCVTPNIVLKRRFAIDDTAAFGLEAGATLPVGRRGIGRANSDYSLNAIYSADIGDYHTDLNLGATRIGSVDAGVSRTQTLWTASLSKSLGARWGVAGELSGTHQRGATMDWISGSPEQRRVARTHAQATAPVFSSALIS